MKNANIVLKVAGKVPSIALVLISEDSTLQEAAAVMRERQCSVLRVGKNGKMENIISAYDIVANAVAYNKIAATTKVRDIMSKSLLRGPSADVALSTVKAVPAKAVHSRKPGRLAFASGIKS